VQATNSVAASSLAEGQIATITASPPADASTQLATYTSAGLPATDETPETNESPPTGGLLSANTDTQVNAQTVSATDMVSVPEATSSNIRVQGGPAAAASHMASSKWVVLCAMLIELAFV
jgi:hypothetical protein